MKNSLFLIILLLAACKGKPENKTTQQSRPIVKEQGKIVEFTDKSSLDLFKTETLGTSNIQADLTAPARIVATTVRSAENSSQNLVLFDNPDLTANYTSLLQHIININQKKVSIEQRKAAITQRKSVIVQRQIVLGRYKDLAEHGAATGKDLSDTQIDINNEESNLISAQSDLTGSETDLANEKTAILEHEAKLKLAGFDPERLIKAKANTSWIICDVPENQIARLRVGGTCSVLFTSFPDQQFAGKIEDIGEVVDNVTRMVKLRIGVTDSKNQLRAGMFAEVKFGISEGNFISVPKEALVTVEGKTYVFVKKNANDFELREVLIGQQVENRIVIFNGLNNGEAIAITNVMQLKGLSFGY